MRSAPHKMRETGLFREVWKEFNGLVDYVRELAVSPNSRGVRVSRTSNGTLLVIDGTKAKTTARVVRMRVSSIQNDHLVCVNLETEQTVSVAKPFNLRSANWEGANITYTLEPYPNAPPTLTVIYDMVTPSYRKATIGSYIEHQVIRPHYVPAFSEIFAAECDNTGVIDVEWIDINADGRAWTMVNA